MSQTIMYCTNDQFFKSKTVIMRPYSVILCGEGRWGGRGGWRERREQVVAGGD